MKREKELYLDWCSSEKNLEEISLEAYSHDLDLFFAFLKENQVESMEAIRTHHFESWLHLCLSQMDEGHPNHITQQTANRRRGSVRRFLRFLYNEDLCGIDPDLTMGRQTNKWEPPSVITEKQVDVLLAAPDKSTYLGLRDAAMLELCYCSGLRVTELITLKLDQIKRGWLEIRGKRGKERKVPYSEKAMVLVDEYLVLRGTSENPHVFLSTHKKTMTRQNFWGRIKRYAKEAGIQAEISPHSLRHAFATHMLNNDADLRSLQKMLGHSDIATTELYLTIAKKKLIQVHQKHHPRGGKG